MPAPCEAPRAVCRDPRVAAPFSACALEAVPEAGPGVRRPRWVRSVATALVARASSLSLADVARARRWLAPGALAGASLGGLALVPAAAVFLAGAAAGATVALLMAPTKGSVLRARVAARLAAVGRPDLDRLRAAGGTRATADV